MSGSRVGGDRKFNEQDDPGNGCVRRRTRHVQKRSRKPLAGRRPMSKPPPPPRVHRPIVLDVHSSRTRTGIASGTIPPSAFGSASSRWSTSCSTTRRATVRAFCSTGRRSSSTTTSRCAPSVRERCAQLLRDGRLEAGPWYVLADELIPSGEALVRNLLAGRRTLRRFGATRRRCSIVRTRSAIRRRCRRSPPASACR